MQNLTSPNSNIPDAIPVHVINGSRPFSEEISSDFNPIYTQKRKYLSLDSNLLNLSNQPPLKPFETLNVNKPFTDAKGNTVDIVPYTSNVVQSIPIYYQVKESSLPVVQPYLESNPVSLYNPTSVKRARTSECVESVPETHGLSQKEVSFFEALHSQIIESEYSDFLKLFHSLIDEKVISVFEFNNMVRDFLSFDPQLYEQFKEIMIERGMPADIETNPFEFVSTSLSQYRRIENSSYITISEECINPKRNNPILNDKYYSFPVSNFFAIKDRNGFDDTLTSMEDNKFEIDVRIEHLRNTIAYLTELMKQVRNPTDSIPDTLSEIQRTTLTEIYGINAKRVIQLLLTFPLSGIPLIIRRLNSLLKDWLFVRELFDKEMNKISEANYLPSYDFLSQAFCENEKKTTSRKALFASLNLLDCTKTFVSQTCQTRTIKLTDTYYQIQPALTNLLVRVMCRECNYRVCLKDFHTFIREFLASFTDFRGEPPNSVIVGNLINIPPFGVGIITDYHEQYAIVAYETFTIETYIPKPSPEMFLPTPNHLHCYLDDTMILFCINYTILVERLCQAAIDFPTKFEPFMILLSQKLTQPEYELQLLHLIGNTSYYLFTLPKIVNKLIRSTKMFLNSMRDISYTFLTYYQTLRPQILGTPETLYKLIHRPLKKRLFYIQIDKAEDLTYSIYSINMNNFKQ